MDKKFGRYYKNCLRVTKSGADIMLFIAMYFIAKYTAIFIPFREQCIKDSQPFYEAVISSPNTKFLDNDNWLYFFNCQLELFVFTWIALWALLLFGRAFCLKRWGGGLCAKISEIRYLKNDGSAWRFGEAVKLTFLEWLPVYVTAALLLAIKIPEDIFEWSALKTFVLLAVFIWLAPAIFRWRGRNIAEHLTNMSVDFTEKRKEKVRRRYNKKFFRWGNKANITLNNLFYALFVTLFIVSAIQILRVPPLHPDFERDIYGGYDIVWDDNQYFALEGLAAPEDVTDFYQYGKRSVYQEFKSIEALKAKIGISEAYLYDAPDLGGFSAEINREQEIEIDSDDWANLDCLSSIIAYEYDAKDCATFTQWESYIAENRVLWDRFNVLPEKGNVYKAIPQILGTQVSLKNVIALGQLKAAHIIYLAEKGQADEAFRQWKTYIDFYRAMLTEKDSAPVKAISMILTGIQLRNLEKLLFVAPELAVSRKAHILETLAFKNERFEKLRIPRDDWGLSVPTFAGAMGNVNAAENEFYKCVQEFEELALTPQEQYPYQQERSQKLCAYDWHESDSVWRTMLHSFAMPGAWKSNFVMSLLAPGLIKGTELITNMKRKQIMFGLAQLGVHILADGVERADIESYIQSAPADLQNPVTRAPFKWDDEKSALYFERPGKDEKYYFHLNLGDR